MSDFNDISRMELAKLKRAGYNPEYDDDDDRDDDELEGIDEETAGEAAEGGKVTSENAEGGKVTPGAVVGGNITSENDESGDAAAVTSDGEDGEAVETVTVAGVEPASGGQMDDRNGLYGGTGSAKKQHMAAPTGKHYYIDAHVTTKEMTAFLFAHTYTSPLMLAATLIGLIWPIYSVFRAQGSILFACVCAGVFLILMPFSIWRRATTNVKSNPLYEHTFHYMIDEAGLHVELAEHAIDVDWGHVTRKMFLKSTAVIYTGKVNAYLIPTAAMGEQKDEIIKFIKEH